MQCRICGNTDAANKKYIVREMMYGYRDTFSYFQCSACKCLQIESIPTDLKKYYRNDYYSYKPIKNKSNLKRKIKTFSNKLAIFNQGFIGKYFRKNSTNLPLLSLSRIPLKLTSRIIDVGCGGGSLIYTLSKTGFRNTLGIDPLNEKDIFIEDRIRILKKNLSSIEGEWDLIMFHHSFEHISNPEETLKTAYKLLAKNGYLLIRIPTVSSYAWEHYGVNWVQLDAPRHLYLHSVESIKILAEKINFKLIDVVYDSTDFQFWGSEQYLNDIPLCAENSYAQSKDNSIFSKKDMRTFKLKANKLNNRNQGDSAAFYFKKDNCT